MSLRRLSFLQWVGTLVAPLAWAFQHILGYSVAHVRCGEGDVSHGISNVAWQFGLLSGAALLVAISGAAAVAVFVATRGEDAESSRHHFFAVAAMVSNLLFFSIILMAGLTSALEKACVQS